MAGSLCLRLWTHLYIAPTGNVTPCCLWSANTSVGNINKNSIQDIANSEPMNQIRAKMLANESVSECWMCNTDNATDNIKRWIDKRYAADSTRLLKNTNSLGQLTAPFEMLEMDIRFSNLCNFACRSCGGSCSSTIAYETGDSNPVKKITDSVPDYVEQIHGNLQTVRRLYIAGGESVLIDENWQLLDKLIELNRTDVIITYVTNLSKLVYKNYSLVEYARKFSNFTIYASIDASFERAKLYRHGTDWNKIEENLQTIREAGLKLIVSPTVGAVNVWHLPDLHRYLLEENLISNNAFMLNILTNPSDMSTKVLPMDFKKIVSEKIDNHIQWLTQNSYGTYNWHNLQGFMNSQDHSHMISALRARMFRLDKLRNENTLEVFPELTGIL